MKKNFIGLLLFFVIFPTFGQKNSIIDSKAIQFEITQENNSINFIVVDTVLTQKKPVFLWCQGSLSYPLFAKNENDEIYMFGGGISNFDISNIVKHYHLVVISMPKVPVIVNEKDLQDFQYCHINSDCRDDFWEADFWENYERRASTVLTFLQRHSWVDNSKLVVAGHSQGSKIAERIAFRNKNVTHLGLFSFNPFGRIEQFIRLARKNAESGKITWEEAEREMQKWYDLYKSANNPQEIANNPHLIPWKSFSEPQIDELVKINIPIYLAYGTADVAGDLCDLLPLYFSRENKDNLKLKRYFNLEHNFFEINEKGGANWDKPHWIEVMNEFVEWTRGIE